MMRYTSNNVARRGTMKRFSRPWSFENDSVVVDVGSNVGADLIRLTQTGMRRKLPPGSVVALEIHTFEPLPKIRAELQSNLERHQIRWQAAEDGVAVARDSSLALQTASTHYASSSAGAPEASRAATTRSELTFSRARAAPSCTSPGMCPSTSPSSVTIHPTGLGHGNRTACFATKASREGYSRLPQVRSKATSGSAEVAGETSVNTECAQIMDAAYIVRRLAVAGRRVSLIHMNCQGCEYDVLRSLGSAELASIDAFEIQFHVAGTRAQDGNLTSAELYCPVGRKLLRHGFWPTYRFPYVWELWERAARPARAGGRAGGHAGASRAAGGAVGLATSGHASGGHANGHASGGHASGALEPVVIPAPVPMDWPGVPGATDLPKFRG